MITNYKDIERRWTNTKPIRGRSTDVRPIGERRRDWEQVVRHPIDEGMWSYAARLYNTDVVTYLPNGDIIINANGWHTPSTAEFIHLHSPFACVKRHNKLWVHARTSEEHPSVSMKAYPLGSGPMRFNHKGGHLYVPAEKVVVRKQVVNRVLAKEAREPLQPFLAWAKAFLTMSDGWVMHETTKEALGWEQTVTGSMHFPLFTRDDRQMYKLLTEQADIEPEHVYLRVLCSLSRSHYYEERLAHTHTFDPVHKAQGFVNTYAQRFHDLRVDFGTIKHKVYGWAGKFENIHDIIEVEVGNDVIRGTV
jgi:hypothetical protein